MFLVNENDFTYRFGNSGPKYLMKGPRMNFALVQFMPGEDFPAHYHEIMEENFYILSGTVEIYVDGKKNVLKTGDYIHIEPREIHYVRNTSSSPVKIVACLAPYQEKDKIEVDFSPEN